MVAAVTIQDAVKFGIPVIADTPKRIAILDFQSIMLRLLAAGFPVIDHEMVATNIFHSYESMFMYTTVDGAKITFSILSPIHWKRKVVFHESVKPTELCTNLWFIDGSRIFIHPTTENWKLEETHHQPIFQISVSHAEQAKVQDLLSRAAKALEQL
jgi:hypothetical protein